MLICEYKIQASKAQDEAIEERALIAMARFSPLEKLTSALPSKAFLLA
jgi:hypothetical protein